MSDEWDGFEDELAAPVFGAVELMLAEQPAVYGSRQIRRFEDFDAWTRARTLTRAVYWVTQNTSASRDFGFRDQIQRAAVSVMSNIAEGYERGRPSEFHQYVSVAKGSAAEVRSLIYVGFDAGYFSQLQFDRLMVISSDVSNLLGALRASVQRRRDSKD